MQGESSIPTSLGTKKYRHMISIIKIINFKNVKDKTNIISPHKNVCNRSSTLSLLTPSVNYPLSVRSESARAAAGVNRSGREGGKKTRKRRRRRRDIPFLLLFLRPRTVQYKTVPRTGDLQTFHRRSFKQKHPPPGEEFKLCCMHF